MHSVGIGTFEKSFSYIYKCDGCCAYAHNVSFNIVVFGYFEWAFLGGFYKHPSFICAGCVHIIVMHTYEHI